MIGQIDEDIAFFHRVGNVEESCRVSTGSNSCQPVRFGLGGAAIKSRPQAFELVAADGIRYGEDSIFFPRLPLLWRGAHYWLNPLRARKRLGSGFGR